MSNETEKKEVKYLFPQPPDILFKQENTGKILNESSKVYIMTGQVDIIENEGVFVYYVGVPYCRKSFVTPEIMFALNQVKKIILESCRLLKNPFFLLGIITYNKTKLLQSFLVVFNKLFVKHVMKEEFMTRSAFNLANFAHRVLLSLKVEGSTAKEFSFAIAQIIEYDDSYRYRYQDLANELNVKLFKENPRKELKRLLAIFKERSDNFVPDKLMPIFSFFSLLLLYPPIKKACIEAVDFIKQSAYDKHDHYWVCIRDDHYNYLGLSLQERNALYTERPQAIDVVS